ncbi:hypothetical protein MC885_006023, partial [Smutsia gigantea]
TAASLRREFRRGLATRKAPASQEQGDTAAAEEAEVGLASQARGPRAQPSNGPSNGRTPPSGVSRKALRRFLALRLPGARLGLRRSGRRLEPCEEPRAVQCLCDKCFRNRC